MSLACGAGMLHDQAMLSAHRPHNATIAACEGAPAFCNNLNNNLNRNNNPDLPQAGD